jgi:3-isopropylmalate dehydrogenase
MRIAVLPGDGIGREVVPQAVKALKALERRGLSFELAEGAVGAAGVEAAGHPLPSATLDLVRKADAILLGAVGGPEHDAWLKANRVRSGILLLRSTLDLYANLRPVRLFPVLVGASSMKPDLVRDLDLVIVRELTADVYFGEPRGIETGPSGERSAINTMRYTSAEIARVAHVAFRLARTRRKKLCSVDKANVLETMWLWREVVGEVAREYSDVELTHLYVDAAAMELLRQPARFDVMLTPNLFGDILSDEAAMLSGSIGMLPSAAIGVGRFGLYEPIHGAAPDIAGRDVANPLATILSAAMMLRQSFGLDDAARRVESAVETVLANGLRTADILEAGTRLVGTNEMGDAVAAAL